jgi:hypothetical protein
VVITGRARARSFRDCYSDEHYFATLLATHGRDNETDCLGGITYAHWERWGDSHPKAWAPQEVNAKLCAPQRWPLCRSGRRPRSQQVVLKGLWATKLSVGSCAATSS